MRWEEGGRGTREEEKRRRKDKEEETRRKKGRRKRAEGEAIKEGERNEKGTREGAVGERKKGVSEEVRSVKDLKKKLKRIYEQELGKVTYNLAQDPTQQHLEFGSTTDDF